MRLSKIYGAIGILITILSFFHWLLPYANQFILPANALFAIGNILFFDYLSYQFSGFSILHNKKSWISLGSHFLVLGLIFGSFAELYVHWIGKFWYYPTFTVPWAYFLTILPIFGLYMLYLLETYLGIKAFLEHIFHHRIKRKESFAGMKKIFIWMGLLGAIGLGASTVFVLMGMSLGGLSQNIFEIIYKPFPSHLSYFIFVAIAIFFWMIFEFLEYEKHETSMLYEFVKGNYFPVVAVFLSAWLSAFLYEGFNVPSGTWRYANFPFSNIAIWGVPVLVFITWPFHYFPAFSLYRVLFKKETKKVWK